MEEKEVKQAEPGNCDCDRCGEQIKGIMFVTDNEQTVDKICYALDAIDQLTTNKQREQVWDYLNNQIKENE